MKPKENFCHVRYVCNINKLNTECVYFSKRLDDDHCKYEDDSYNCTSKLAQINAMYPHFKPIIKEAKLSKYDDIKLALCDTVCNDKPCRQGTGECWASNFFERIKP